MKPTHRKTLNQEQLKVLYALYKFRFGTEKLLAISIGTGSRKNMHVRVRNLYEQEYIGRRYGSSYKLAGRAAEYYLLPRGIEVLKKRPADFKPQMLRNIRKDVSASDRFARHCINIFAVYCKYKELYGEVSGSNFYFYTKSYMTGDKAEDFPDPLPDAFASFKTAAGQQTRHAIVECFDDTMPHSVMRKRIERLADHADAGEWTLTPAYPAILLVCKTNRLRKYVQQWARQELDHSWSNDLVIHVVALDEEKWEL